MFAGKVVETEVFSDEAVMTYDHYHTVLKGATPRTAPTFLGLRSLRPGDDRYPSFRGRGGHPRERAGLNPPIQELMDPPFDHGSRSGPRIGLFYRMKDRRSITESKVVLVEMTMGEDMCHRLPGTCGGPVYGDPVVGGLVGAIPAVLVPIPWMALRMSLGLCPVMLMFPRSSPFGNPRVLMFTKALPLVTVLSARTWADLQVAR